MAWRHISGSPGKRLRDGQGSPGQTTVKSQGGVLAAVTLDMLFGTRSEDPIPTLSVTYSVHMRMAAIKVTSRVGRGVRKINMRKLECDTRSKHTENVTAGLD